MPSRDNPELRSDEVQEILGTPPSWLISWGTTMALVFLAVLGWVGYLINYPDTVEGEIKVSSTDPPKNLVATSPGFLELILVENEDTVAAGQTLIVFQSRAKFEDVLSLDDNIVAVREWGDSALLSFTPPSDLLLGEIQDDFYEFIEKQESFRQNISNTYEDFSISQLESKIRRERRLISYELKRKTTLEKELELVQKRFIREQNLYNSNLFSLDKLRKTEEEVVALQRQIQGIESILKNKAFEIELVKSEISGVQSGSAYSKTTAASEFRESFLTLQDGVEAWKKEFLIVSPIDGIFLLERENVSENQFLRGETKVGVVVPLEKKETLGRMNLKNTGTGKIKKGQEVIVKLNSYPFEEFGALIGVVSWKGSVLTDDKVPVDVSFPEGMTTTSGFTIKGNQQMVGEAQIILEKKRFIERVFERVRSFHR